MSIKVLTEGFDVRAFELLKENSIERIKSILSDLNEAEMSDEDRRDSQILRQILGKASDASYDRRRSLNYTPAELEVADKYNLTLPAKVKKWDGTTITSLSDKDVDTPRGTGRDRYTPSLSRDIEKANIRRRTDANLANFVRTRKEKGPRDERPYSPVDKFARVDDPSTFGDTTFMHDKSGRFGQDSWDKEHGRAPTLAGGRRTTPSRRWIRDKEKDLTDVEKDRIAVNKQMSQPVKDMKKALKDRQSNQQDLDNVNLNYARNVADARRRFDDAMAYADEQKRKESERGRQGLDDANSRINKLLKKESLDKSVREKGEVKLGDGIHIYHMFGFPEYREAEGVVKFIDGDEIYGSWGDDPLTFSDDWEIIDDSRMFESFRKALKEKIMSLKEAEMSDEDKRDTEILKDIYKKTQVRANAALTPEEKAVLQKYNLDRVTWDKNVHGRKNFNGKDVQGSALFQRGDFDKKWNRNKFQYDDPKADKINYADRARKRPARDEQQDDLRDRDYWDMPTPDYAARHERDADDEWNPLTDHTYQKAERHSENQKMTQNVRDMKRALRDRKASQAKVDSADADLQGQLDKLKKEYEDRIAGVRKGHEWRTDSSRKDVERNQAKIDQLLKRGKQ